MSLSWRPRSPHLVVWWEVWGCGRRKSNVALCQHAPPLLQLGELWPEGTMLHHLVPSSIPTRLPEECTLLLLVMQCNVVEARQCRKVLGITHSLANGHTPALHATEISSSSTTQPQMEKMILNGSRRSGGANWNKKRICCRGKSLIIQYPHYLRIFLYFLLNKLKI